MEKLIVKGRNNNYSLNKLSLNSTSTNSFISDEKLKHKRKINSYKNLVKENNYYFDNFIINNDKLKIIEKNKIINLSCNKNDKSENNCELNLSQKIYIDKKFKNKKKLINLYTEYDSKINLNENNKIIDNNKFFINNKTKNYNEKIGFKFSKMKENIQRTKYMKLNDINLFYINNKASLESSKSKFINFDIIKERTSFIESLTNTKKTYLDNINKNNLIKIKENKSMEFIEIEFEDYIKKLNSGNFNIDRELKERPLFQLINKYELNLRFHSLNKISKDVRNYSKLKTKLNIRKNNSLNSKNMNNKKANNKNTSLRKINKDGKKKSNKIILDKINNKNNSASKYRIINTRNEIHKNIYLNKSENNYKTELSTSSNSKSKLLINNNNNFKS